MGKYQPFSFRGCGYVQDLELTDHTAKLSIQVVQLPPNECADTVNLECTISPALQEKIRQLNLRCPYTSGVMVWFDVVFSSLGACFSDASSNSSQIVLLKGELETVRSWKRDPNGLCPL